MKHAGSLLSLCGLSVIAVVLVIPHPLTKVSVLDARSTDDSRFAKLAAAQAGLTLSNPGKHTSDQSRLVAGYGKLPLSFEVNRGQTDPRVKFLSRGKGYALFLTGDEAVLTSREDQEETPRSALWTLSHLIADPPHSPLPMLARAVPNPMAARHSSVHLKLLAADPQAKIVGLEELPGKVNYFIGNDPKKWRTDVPTFAKVEYKNIYPGVDLVYYGNQEGRLEYDFVVAPGADPNVIQLAVATDNESPLEISSGGDLVVKTGGVEIHFQKPVVYQQQSPAWTVAQRLHEPSISNASNRKSQVQDRQFLEGHYVLTADNRVGFEVGGYDRNKPLVIDPTLVYSTYLGGSLWDMGEGIALDSSGNVYVIGATASTDFPLLNAIQTSNADIDVFVTKLDSAGDALVYSTYLGGNSLSEGRAIAVDSSGSAYVTGYTSGFPTVNPIQPAFAGGPGGDAFIAKLNASGNALVYSTYLGGSGSDEGFGIAVDSLDNAYVTGCTDSSDFPTTPGAFQAAFGGGEDGACGGDGFVAKVNPAGSALVYSTYLGGSNGDESTGIAVDSSGNAYVTGWATSTDFPTMNPIQAANAGGYDAFLTELNPAGSALIYSTYLGGSIADFGKGIAVDSQGNAYMTGYTCSLDFPTTSGAFQTTNASGVCTPTVITGDVFVTKFNAAGNALVYSTYLGGNGFDWGSGIAVDPSGDAYVTGCTDSTDFPTTAGALQGTFQGEGDHCGTSGGAIGSDAFVTKLNASGSALVYSTYLGGNSGDVGNSIAVDSTGNVYLTGSTASGNFPTANPLQAANAGAYDVFITKISTAPDFAVAVASGTPSSATINAGATATYSLALSPIAGFNQRINLTCSGAPATTNCTPSPASVTLDGTNSQNVTVSVTTTARAMSASLQWAQIWPANQMTVALTLWVAVFVVVGPARYRHSRRFPCLLALSAIAAALLLSVLGACSSSSGTTKTPAGTYTIVVTGTDTQVTPNLNHGVTLNLTVD